MAEQKKLYIDRAIAGLEFGPTDDTVLKNLGIFIETVPVTQIKFLHVIPRRRLPNFLFSRESDVHEWAIQLAEEERDKIRQKVHSMLPGSKTLIDFAEGDPLEEMLKEEKKYDAELLIIGQKSGQSHGILGKQLARKARSNALIFPEGSRINFKTIVVPFDFSEHSVWSLNAAIAISEQTSRQMAIHCVYVYELPDLNVYRASKTLTEYRQTVYRSIIEHFHDKMDSNFPEHFDKISFHAVEKDLPGTTKYLYDYALEAEAGMVIMGAKGHSKVDRLLFGSVTESFLNANKKIPTLVVKH